MKTKTNLNLRKNLLTTLFTTMMIIPILSYAGGGKDNGGAGTHDAYKGLSAYNKDIGLIDSLNSDIAKIIVKHKGMNIVKDNDEGGQNDGVEGDEGVHLPNQDYLSDLPKKMYLGGDLSYPTEQLPINSSGLSQ